MRETIARVALQERSAPMFFLQGYINPVERKEADRKLPRLMFEGLLLGGTGLGVLALVFEIAADAFSVAAYQTLLAIDGAQGYHEIAMLAFAVLSVMLFFGVVPAYKAGAYLRPNAGGTGPLVEAIGPPRMRFLSWVGTSLFFIDAVLTIIISSISASDVTLLIFPELAPWRITMAEAYAFFIMAVLSIIGPRRAVPLFLVGGGAFTIFTIFALSWVALNAAAQPELANAVPAIVQGLENSGVVTHVVEASGDVSTLSTALFFQFFLRSMSSAMLGFSGYEVIPASGKHAARPKWKVINTALIIAAVFLIGTGIVQLFAASTWRIPATEGYSTLLIQYELIFGSGTSLLGVAGILLAFILLLAQGGGYVGGAAVAANAARLGRLPRQFEDDRVGVVVIWAVAAILIPVIRTVTQVEAFYAFGFVSEFAMVSTTIFLVGDDVLKKRGIKPKSSESRALRFAGLRGMVASYAMLLVLITQKTDAIPPIAIGATCILLFQLFVHRGGIRRVFPLSDDEIRLSELPGRLRLYRSGRERARDEARQHGIADRMEQLISSGALVKFNVEPQRFRRLISHTHDVLPEAWMLARIAQFHGERIEEPSEELEACFQAAWTSQDELVATIEHYSHYGIFTFIDKYSHNWAGVERDEAQVQHYMVRALFPRTPEAEIWQEYQKFHWEEQPEAVWQFSRQRYIWAKDQWPNVSGPMTTMWTLEDLGLLDKVDPALVQKLHEARRLPSRLERMDPLDDDHLDHNVEDDGP
ncbi:MAG: hypothetical protein OXF32_14560 [Anaerolineaceae bacterium]|nr:hypothetical protein [Anaerolineaceae bacterium]